MGLEQNEHICKEQVKCRGNSILKVALQILGRKSYKNTKK